MPVYPGAQVFDSTFDRVPDSGVSGSDLPFFRSLLESLAAVERHAVNHLTAPGTAGFRRLPIRARLIFIDRRNNVANFIASDLTW
jgi:hypothetical protein